MSDKIEIKALYTLEELRPVVELQRVYWGENVESVIPAHMLFSLATHGGHVFGAFNDDSLIGMLVGFLGTHREDNKRPAMANLQIVSKRMVVLPSYRGSGVGYRLKLAQRDAAIQQGIRLVEWTFDPLLSLNAHLNLRKLGAICPRYLRDYYGTSGEGGLATLGSSDRLLVEWWVTHRRVEERLYGKRGDLTLAQYIEAGTPILNATTITDDGLVLPAKTGYNPTRNALALVEIPLNYPSLIKDNPELAKEWRAHSRAVLEGAFAHGFVITDFVRGQIDRRERGFYVLSFNGSESDGLILN
jgi:predicted GNAT superfamily acetyltransferase